MDKHQDPPSAPKIEASGPDPGAGSRAAESTAETVGFRVEQLLQERGWSVYRLHQESGLSERHLGEIVADEVGKPRLSTLIRISDALGVPVTELDPSAPRGRDFSITLSAPDEDVLYAVAANERRPIGSVVRQAVIESLSRWREDASIKAILSSMKDRDRG